MARRSESALQGLKVAATPRKPLRRRSCERSQWLSKSCLDGRCSARGNFGEWHMVGCGHVSVCERPRLCKAILTRWPTPVCGRVSGLSVRHLAAGQDGIRERCPNRPGALQAHGHMRVFIAADNWEYHLCQSTLQTVRRSIYRCSRSMLPPPLSRGRLRRG